MAEPEYGPINSEDGFSFLELVASLFVLALIAAALTSSLHLGLKAWDRTGSANGAAGQAFFAQKALRQFLEAARPVPVASGQPNGPLWFSGKADTLQIISQMPSQFGLGGAYSLTIAARFNASGSKDLTLTPVAFGFDAQDWPPTTAQSDNETVVLENVTGIAVRYFGDPQGGNAAVWTPTWEGRSTLPLLIAIDVTFPQDDPRLWPTLIVAPALRGGIKL